MIADIIKEIYRGESDDLKLGLLEEPIICGNIFRSLDDFTQHLIFLLYSNQGIFYRSQIIASMDHSPFKSEGCDRLSAALGNLNAIKIISYSSTNGEKIILNDSFQNKLNHFIMASKTNFGEPHNENH